MVRHRHQRAEHADELDDAVGAWIAARPTAEVLAAFESAEAAVGPVYDVRGVLADPQYAAIGTVHTVDDDELGPVKMQNVLFRLSETPGLDPLGRPPPRRRHRRRPRASSASTPTSSPSCARRAPCDPPPSFWGHV